MIATEEQVQKVKHAKELQTEIERLTQELNEIKQDFKEILTDGILLNSSGDKIVTISQIKSNRLDTKKLKTEAPEIYNKFLTESVSTRINFYLPLEEVQADL